MSISAIFYVLAIVAGVAALWFGSFGYGLLALLFVLIGALVSGSLSR